MTVEKFFMHFEKLGGLMVDLSVIIPVRNKEAKLTEFFNQLEKELHQMSSNYEIVFVDDGSKDSTFKLLSSIRDSNGMVKLIRLAGNYGMSNAITAGIENSVGEIIVIMDSEMRYLPKDIKLLLDPLQAYDIPMTVGNLITSNHSYIHKILIKLKQILNGKSKNAVVSPGIFRAITRTAYRSVTENSNLKGTTLCRIKTAQVDFVTIDIHRHGKSRNGTRLFNLLRLAWTEFLANTSWSIIKETHNPNYKIDKII